MQRAKAMNHDECLEGWRAAEGACAAIIATSRTPDEARMRLRRLLRQLILALGYS